MKKTLTRRDIKEGSHLPRGFGYAWIEWDKDTLVCYPIPINLVVGIARAVWNWIRWGCYLVPADPRNAYAQGYRDGWWKARGCEEKTI